jgi:hypothetical protein
MVRHISVCSSNGSKMAQKMPQTAQKLPYCGIFSWWIGKLHLQLHLFDILESTDMKYLFVFYEQKKHSCQKTGIFVGILKKLFLLPNQSTC